jgi:GAF domain-containing protein
MLALIALSVNAGAASLARETAEGWTIVQVFDRVAMGLEQGWPAPFSAALGSLWRRGPISVVLVEEVQRDLRFTQAAAGYPGVGSYLGVPLTLTNGELYGVLGVVHPAARTITGGEVALVRLSGRILVQLLDTMTPC